MSPGWGLYDIEASSFRNFYRAVKQCVAFDCPGNGPSDLLVYYTLPASIIIELQSEDLGSYQTMVYIFSCNIQQMPPVKL
jgi:hypothetical protein